LITSLNLYKDKITKLESLLPGISNNFRFYLKKALNYSDSSIILSDDIYVSDQEASLIEEFINLSKKQVPIEYILNDSEFYGRNFYVDNRVLIPRDETELIIDILLDQDIKNTSKIIDLGTGSGCLGISIALELPESSVLGVDKYLDAIDVAIKNKDIHRVSNFNVKQSDWFSNVNEENFELVVSNPPYIESTDIHLKNLNHEPRSALVSQEKGLLDLKKICSQAYNKLKKDGILILEHGYNQADDVKKIMELNNYSEIENFKDYHLHPRITLGKK
tara:strand:- start:7147 stop:7974 length:828 start_codon:yes stop_codon:yes gene_type:complete